MNLPVKYFEKGTCEFQEGKQQFYLSNEDQFKNEINKIGLLEDIFYNCIVDKKHKRPF
jgi:hypothetical protein